MCVDLFPYSLEMNPKLSLASDFQLFFPLKTEMLLDMSLSWENITILPGISYPVRPIKGFIYSLVGDSNPKTKTTNSVENQVMVLIPYKLCWECLNNVLS